MHGVDASRLVFIDESGAKTNMTPLRGRAPRGDRVYDSVPTSRWETTTMIAAVRSSGPCAPMLLEGAMDGLAFAAWTRDVLAPALRPGDIVVMDNLSSHKNASAREAIAAAGASVLDLPSYSPDFNPIENMWSKIKTALRAAKARTAEELERAVAAALETITRTDIAGWFRNCGYTI